MCTLYRIVHNLIYFPTNVFLPKYNSVVPAPFTNLLHKPIHSLQFCSVSCILWNNLPQEALVADLISSFKSLVHPIFLYP